MILAAELRARARLAKPRERDELLFLAAEYEKLIEAQDPDAPHGAIDVLLPR